MYSKIRSLGCLERNWSIRFLWVLLLFRCDSFFILFCLFLCGTLKIKKIVCWSIHAFLEVTCIQDDVLARFFSEQFALRFCVLLSAWVPVWIKYPFNVSRKKLTLIQHILRNIRDVYSVLSNFQFKIDVRGRTRLRKITLLYRLSLNWTFHIDTERPTSIFIVIIIRMSLNEHCGWTLCSRPSSILK